MFLFQGQSKTVDDASQNFKQLGDTVVSLGLVNELEKDVVDRPSNEGAQVKEFAIDAVERGLQEISLTRVFTVEKFQKLLEEVCVGHQIIS